MRKKSPAILGLDLSLSFPAAVFLPAGWKIGDWKRVIAFSFETPSPESWVGHYVRIHDIWCELDAFADRHGAEDIVFEDYAFGASSSSVTKLAELGGYVRTQFLEWRGYEVVVSALTATHARKILLGKVPKGAKKLVEQSLKKVGAPFKNDNETDAFCCANARLSDLGYPCLMLHNFL